jgi:hypothetical protein
MIEELVCACVFERLDDLAAYYEALDDPWARRRSHAITTLAKQYQRTGIKALVDFQRQRQHDLRAALRGTTGLYAGPHTAKDSATHARHLQSLFREGRFISGLIGLA